MATTTHPDFWMRPRADRISEPSPSEQRFFERRDSDPPRQSWTNADLHFESDGYSTPISTRRASVARAVGVVGVLAAIGLAVAAFAPRMPLVTSELALLANHVELPWDPTLQPGPAPLPLDRAPTVASPLAASDTAAPSAAPAVTPPAAPIETPPVAETTPPLATPARETTAASKPQPEARFESREPTLSAEEIERREQRYEEWLKSENLERVR